MAAITSLATLKTAIADYLARDDLSSYLDYFITATENKLRRTLNLRNEETALSVSISGGVAAVPTGFKALKFAYFDGSPTYLLEWVPVEEIYARYMYRGEKDIPEYISREGTNFIFGPTSKDGTLKGIYYKKQDSLLTTDPSWYCINAPEVLLYGSLLEAESFIQNDVRLPVWREKFIEAVETLKEEQRMSETARSNLVQRPLGTTTP